MSTTRNPFEPYGQAKKHPVVPEPSAYGLGLMLAILVILAGHRYRRRA